jgi:prepilin-type processing-associated H-X9-DG protein
MFYPHNPKTMDSVIDGTSNTIAISEAVVDAVPSNNVKGGVAIVSGIWTLTSVPTPDINDFTLIPSLCMAVKNGNRITGAYRTTASAERCSRYLDGLVLYSGFCTIMPPNTPNCTCNATEVYWGLYTSSSNHPGGVNCGRVDGSVSFVAESIDTGGLPDTAQGNDLTGESSYGVWGALGTPSGGEAKGL